MPSLHTYANKVPGATLHCSHSVGHKHGTLPRASRVRAKAAAQPSPDEMAKMQEAMNAAMKDPQAGFWPVV